MINKLKGEDPQISLMLCITVDFRNVKVYFCAYKELERGLVDS